MSNILDGKYIKNGTITAAKLTGVILNDIGSPTSPYNFGNQELRNLSKSIFGANTTSDYIIDISNCIYTANFVGAEKSSVKLTGTYTADYFNTIDAYYHTSATVPSGKIGFQFTGGGSFFCVGTSNNYGTGVTHFNFSSGFFPTENMNGIKVAEALLFTTNNTGTIGTSSVAVANIYAVNALNITSDNNEKKDINKSFPLGLNFALDIAKNAIATYKWKDTIQEEKKVTNFKKVEKIDKKTNEKTIDYELETIILEEKKVTKHTRNHLGFLGVELYDTIKQHGFDTNQIGFLSIDNENGLNFDKKGNPIIENNRPKGKITIKTGEMIPILFNAIFELNKIVDDLKKEIQVLKEK